MTPPGDSPYNSSLHANRPRSNQHYGRRPGRQRGSHALDAAPLRNHQRRLASLTDAELQAVAAQALPCAATVEANRRTSARLALELKQSADKTAIQTQLIQLRRDNGAAVAASVGQLRAALGQQPFAYLDQRVRSHVVKNLKIYTVQQPTAAPPEGK